MTLPVIVQTRNFGICVEHGTLAIEHIAPGTSAKALGVQINDELVSVAGENVTAKNWSRKFHSAQLPFRIELWRDLEEEDTAIIRGSFFETQFLSVLSRKMHAPVLSEIEKYSPRLASAAENEESAGATLVDSNPWSETNLQQGPIRNTRGSLTLDTKFEQSNGMLPNKGQGSPAMRKKTRTSTLPQKLVSLDPESTQLQVKLKGFDISKLSEVGEEEEASKLQIEKDIDAACRANDIRVRVDALEPQSWQKGLRDSVDATVTFTLLSHALSNQRAAKGTYKKVPGVSGKGPSVSRMVAMLRTQLPLKNSIFRRMSSSACKVVPATRRITPKSQVSGGGLGARNPVIGMQSNKAQLLSALNIAQEKISDLESRLQERKIVHRRAGANSGVALKQQKAEFDYKMMQLRKRYAERLEICVQKYNLEKEKVETLQLEIKTQKVQAAEYEYSLQVESIVNNITLGIPFEIDDLGMEVNMADDPEIKQALMDKILASILAADGDYVHEEEEEGGGEGGKGDVVASTEDIVTPSRKDKNWRDADSHPITKHITRVSEMNIDDLEERIRADWQTGDILEVYSKTLGMWLPAKIINLTPDSDGNILDVIYHDASAVRLGRLEDHHSELLDREEIPEIVEQIKAEGKGSLDFSKTVDLASILEYGSAEEDDSTGKIAQREGGEAEETGRAGYSLTIDVNKSVSGDEEASGDDDENDDEDDEDDDEEAGKQRKYRETSDGGGVTPVGAYDEAFVLDEKLLQEREEQGGEGRGEKGVTASNKSLEEKVNETQNEAFQFPKAKLELSDYANDDGDEEGEEERKEEE
eukprot:jgi/Bigna1/77374/fgenesh1_pg.47_\